MAEWYVKELSKLTGVTVRALHHYDAISLLKPSIRLENGYRLYSEKDLLKLQQIIALKFFGFELSKIKKLLREEVNVMSHFVAQSQFLEEKAKALLEASQTLKQIISSCGHESIPWERVIKLIEVYQMTQQLEHTWVGKILDAEELKEYATFEKGLKKRFTEAEKKKFETSWANLITKLNENLDKDPSSRFGINLGKECMDLVNILYGTEHVGLRNSIWEKGYKGGNMGAEHHLSPEHVAWLDKAMSAYYKERIYGLLDKEDATALNAIADQWETLLIEMCGHSEERRKVIFEAVQKDDKISLIAKNWVKSV